MNQVSPKGGAGFCSTAMFLVLSAALPSPAVAQVRGVIDTAVRSTAASDPIETGRDGSALSAGIQVDPSVFYEVDATSVTLKGSASLDWYTGGRGTASALSASGAINHRLDRRTALGLTTSVSTTRSAVQDFLRDVGPAGRGSFLGPGAPASAPEAAGRGEDLLVGGLVTPDLLEAYRGRVTTMGIDASLTRALSRRDGVFLGAGLRSTDSQDPAASDFRVVTGSVAYQRRLSERASVNATVVGGRADYGNRTALAGRNSSYLTPMVSVSLQLSEAVTATVGAGVSIVKLVSPGALAPASPGSASQQASAPDRWGVLSAVGAAEEPTRTSFAGQVDVCQRLDRGNLCLSANRAAQATAFAGVTTVTAVNFSLNREVDEQSSVGLAAALSKRDGGQDQQFLLAQTQRVIAITGHLTRKLGQRMSAFVSPGFSKITGGALDGRDNVQVSVGIRYRFGN